MLCCEYTKENNINIENAGIHDVIKFMFNYKGFYFTIHNSKIIISDHPAKIYRHAGESAEIRRIPLSYNGWLVWKNMIIESLEEISRKIGR